MILNKSANSNFSAYISQNYHGFHLKRVIQLVGDGLIQFNSYLFIDKLYPLKFVLFPLFFLVYLYKQILKEKIFFCYLIMLWFIVPWFLFATYSGEISDYYFSINKFIALLIISYFFAKLWMIKNIVPKTAVLIVLIYFSASNFMNFLTYKDVGLLDREQAVKEAVSQNKKIGFTQGVPESYLYWYYMWLKGRNVY